ncbi:O-antigen ligase family protein [Acidobacteria bacterium AH-259-D05]|nr:O-antigen ligase family protein [Acidobacteria bacterium AH-259-D05]
MRDKGILQLQRYLSSDMVRNLVIVSGIIFAYYIGRQIAAGIDFNILLLVAAALSGLVLLNPRLGLYIFCFTLILVPYHWRIFFKIAPSTMVIGTCFVAWATSVALRRSRLYFSELYLPVGLAAAIACLNLLRYSEPYFFIVPYIFCQSLGLFFLGYQLIQNRRYLRQLLTALALAIIVRDLLDVSMQIHSLAGGNSLGVIRLGELWMSANPSTEAGWRSLLMPLFIMLVLLLPNRRSQILYGMVLLLEVAWLSLAGSRTAVMGLVLVPFCLLIVASATERRQLLRLTPLLGLVVVSLAVFFSGPWDYMYSTTVVKSEGGLWIKTGRTGYWVDAFQAFLKNPLWGHSVGINHSYFLFMARTMGLSFLAPLGFALWKIWRHGAWLKTRPLDRLTRALVIGLQAGLLLSLVLNLTGTTFTNAVPSFYFWLLVGAQEAIYLDVRTRRYAIVQKPIESGDDESS